jgi:hypothetical protein
MQGQGLIQLLNLISDTDTESPYYATAAVLDQAWNTKSPASEQATVSALTRNSISEAPSVPK